MLNNLATRSRERKNYRNIETSATRYCAVLRRAAFANRQAPRIVCPQADRLLSGATPLTRSHTASVISKSAIGIHIN